MDTINIGIAGFDHVHLTKYIPAFAEHKKVNIVAIAYDGGPNMELGRETAQKFGCRFYTDYDKFFGKEKLDAIYIATDPISHLEIVKMTATKGIHILCDKPIATNMEDADRIIEVVNKTGINFMVPFNPRFQIPLQKAKEKMESGEIGDLIHIYAVKIGKNPLTIPNFDTGWFADPKRAGFGGFGDIGIHAIDALRWLTESGVKKVFARIDSKIHNLKVDDFGVMMVEFENKTTATLVSGWANPAGYPTWLDVRFEILGSDGVLKIEKPYHDFQVYDENAGSRKDWWRDDINMLVNEFVQSIIKKRKPVLDGENARENLKVLLAAYESSKQKREISMRYLF